MIIRGRHFPNTTYRKRRQQACTLLRAAFDAEWPLLLLGYTLDDEFNLPNPLVGAMRQDPWLDYYSGCHEANAALLIDPTTNQRDTLFLDAGDPARIVWEGKRLAPGGLAKRSFGVHNTASIDDLRDVVERAAKRAGNNLLLCWREREPGIQSRAAQLWRRRLRGIHIHNAEDVLVHQRMIKEPAEVASMRQAIAVTWRGLKATLPLLPRLRNESEVAGELLRHYVGPEHQGLAFTSIVGSGINGATLHYPHNDQPLVKKAPVLIDSGARSAGYCADVTRTVPQHGRFDDSRFREVYELVLRCNALGRRHAKPGITLNELNDIAWKPIIDAGFKRLHGLSHHIGLDVHDPSDRNTPLAPGMVISNEPGVYLANEGFGIRIEDDLLITKTGCEELTRMIPKTVRAIEKLMTR